MTKALLRKQLMELFSFLWRDKKRNRSRTGGRLVLSVVLYLLLFALLAAIFSFLAWMLCAPLVEAGMGWLYFALMGLIGAALGVFGSVFNTYASLYQARDNSMLLAMPISPGRLLLVRLTGVYAMGLLYELLIMAPTLVIYFIAARPGILSVLFSILIVFLLSIFVLTLSTVLGWVVALISGKVRHKSLVTVALSLAFIAAYYYLYLKAYSMLQRIIAAPEIAGDFVRGRLYPLYQMGLAAEGDPAALLIFSAMVLALFAVVCLVLARSYTRLSTFSRGAAKKQYRERSVKAASVGGALFHKELRRFLGSPTYMLNCGLGTLIMVIGAAALLIKGGDLAAMLYGLLGKESGLVPLIACAALCMISCMNDTAAPSVSLEGKNLWLVQSFPVSGQQVLGAKLRLHLAVTLPPAALLTAAVELVLRPAAAYALLIPAVFLLFIWFMGELGLTVNLLSPNLDWTNEIVPIKQSMSVAVTLLGGWVLVTALGALYWLLSRFVSPVIYLACVCAALLIAALALLAWLKRRGARIFEAL